MTTSNWWNDYYPIRRNLKITGTATSPILTNYPVYLSYDYNDLVTLEKLNNDFDDFEVLYWDSALATPQWQVLGRLVEYDAGNNIIFVTFNAISNISAENTDYYVYMGNPTLTGAPSRPPYTSYSYIIIATPTNNAGLMFSRPTEDWVSGVSDVENARASLRFDGINVRLKVEKGPDKGILEVKLDNENPVLIDTYSPVPVEAIVYESTDLSKDRHYLRMRVTGNKSPASTSSKIKIVSIEYSKYIEAADQGEEFRSLAGPITSIVGV